MPTDRLKPQPQEEEAGAPAWMVTFADMMTLLLCFFALLLSFSQVDATKYPLFIGSIKDAFGTTKDSKLTAVPGQGTPVLVDQSAQQTLLEELQSLTPNSFSHTKSNKGKVVLLSVPGKVLYESGEAELKPEMHAHLRKIAELVRSKPSMKLRVDGHTDDIPIRTPSYASNWELSSARATAVIRFLIEECGVPADRLVAGGYADTRPLAANDDLKNEKRTVGWSSAFPWNLARPKISAISKTGPFPGS